MMERLTWKWRV